jgi:hypothetical protein
LKACRSRMAFSMYFIDDFIFELNDRLIPYSSKLKLMSGINITMDNTTWFEDTAENKGIRMLADFRWCKAFKAIFLTLKLSGKA